MRFKFEDIAINSIAKRKPTVEDMLSYIGLEHLDAGSLSVGKFGSKVPIKGEKLIMLKGDVLFGRRNTYLKRAAIAPHDGIFSAHGMVLRPRVEVITKEFFPFFISSEYFFDAAIRISVGSISPTVNWGTLKNLKFDLPSIDLQKRISKVLWAITDTINAYMRLVYLTGQLVKSQFIEMFGDPVIDDRGWGIRLFKEYLTSVRYGTSTPPPYCETGLAFIRATNIKRGRVVDEEMKFISEEEGCKIEKCRLNGGEIIIVRSGVNTGDSCVVPMKYAGHFAGYDIVIEVDKERINAVFLNELLNTSYQALVIKPLTARSAQPHLNAEQVKSLPIIQAPLALQNRFADFVEQADKSKFVIISMLKKGIPCLREIV
jgi:type I restriction enzyme S subunit